MRGHLALKSLVWAVVLVVLEVLAEDSKQMLLVEYDHVVEQLSSQRADEPLAMRVHSRCPRCGKKCPCETSHEGAVQLLDARR